MRTARTSALLLALLIANALAILFFRYFITIDGPVHVLRASLLGTPWGTSEHIAHGVTYNGAGIRDGLGDRILSALLFFSTPELAHDLYVALVCCAVVLSAVAFARVHGTRMGPAILWLAPVTFGPLLIMGLLHFLLGVAIALGSVAWWKWREGAPWWRWFGLVLGAALAWSTHRGASIILCALLIPGLLISAREQGGLFRRIAPRYRGWLLGGIGALLLGSTARVWPVLVSVAQRMAMGPPMIAEAHPLRPLFLLDPEEERWTLGCMGLLLAISFVTAIRARWRLGRRWLWHDPLLLGMCVLALLAATCHRPTFPELHIAERGRWLLFLFGGIWLAAIADARGGWSARVIGAAAVGALPLHSMRLVRAEAALAPLAPVHAAVMEAAGALGAHNLVWPVMADPDRMLQHIEAYVAIRHDGILVAPGEQVRLVLPTEVRRQASWLYTEDPRWLTRQWRKGIPPEVDQVLFIGSGRYRADDRHPWSTMLRGRYRLSFDNGTARIWTAVQAE